MIDSPTADIIRAAALYVFIRAFHSLTAGRAKSEYKTVYSPRDRLQTVINDLQPAREQWNNTRVKRELLRAFSEFQKQHCVRFLLISNTCRMSHKLRDRSFRPRARRIIPRPRGTSDRSLLNQRELLFCLSIRIIQAKNWEVYKTGFRAQYRNIS